jgi:hypothetical protein
MTAGTWLNGREGSAVDVYDIYSPYQLKTPIAPGRLIALKLDSSLRKIAGRPQWIAALSRYAAAYHDD